MTQIELFGCTQAGKSTLASNIIRAGQEHGIAVLLSDDFVLQQARLNWIKSSLPRTLLLDLFSLSACLQIHSVLTNSLARKTESDQKYPEKDRNE
jgi:hypothetical protein